MGAAVHIAIGRRRQWRHVSRAIDQLGQVIDVLVCPPRDTKAARRFLEQAIGTTKVTPVEVVTNHARAYPGVLKELLPAIWHRTDQYANNRVEADRGRLKLWLRPCVAASRTVTPG